MKISILVTSFFLWIVLTGMLVSCSSAPMMEEPVTSEQARAAMTVESNPILQTASLQQNYGVSILVKSLCTDGVSTTLSLQTDLDAALWHLNEANFYPRGSTYFETGILLLENNEMYSTVSSGTREDPVFDPRSNIVSTIQRFVFPRTPLPESEFTLKAKVSVGELPAAYTPPIGLSFLEPGMIEIPVEYVTPATLHTCP